MLPYSLGASFTSVIGGIVISRTGKYRPSIWISWAVMVLGSGLMIRLDEDSNTSVFSMVQRFLRRGAEPLRSAEQVLYLLVAALGVGILFQAPLIAVQAAMPLKEMATSTATFGLIRTLGGTVGISVGQAILSSVRC